MKHLLPLSVLALVLAGCADDNATNPWSTAEERAEGKSVKAAKKHDDAVAQKDAAAAKASPAATLTPVSELNYSFLKKKDEALAEAAPAVPAVLEANRAKVTAVRADAGLIQIKRSEPANPGDKFVLTKDGKSLLVTVSVVDGDAIIANIAPKQVNTPAIFVGDELPCVAPAEKTEEKK